MSEGNRSRRSQGHSTPDMASRAQASLAEASGQLYHRAYKNLKDLSGILITATEEGQSFEHVNDLFEEWRNKLQDLYEFEQEYRRFLVTTSVEGHDKRFRRRIDILCEVRIQVRAALEQLQLCDNRNNSARVTDAEPNLRRDADLLNSRIRRAQSDITATREQLLKVTQPRRTRSMATVAIVGEEDDESLSDVIKLRKSTKEDSKAVSVSVKSSEKDESRELTTVEVLDKLASVIANTKKKNRLPAMEPPVFDGDLLKFPVWLNSLEGLMETQAESTKERLHYLGKYTSGIAHEAVSGYLGLQAEDSYQRAKEVLLSKFGDHIRISDAYRKKLSSWPAIKKSDPVLLSKFADFLWQCHAAMDSIGHLEFLNNSDENVKLARKLPTFVADRWNRVIHNWRYGSEKSRKNGKECKGVYPDFKEFCSFVAEEALVAEGPCNFHLTDSAPISTIKEGKEPKRKAISFGTQAEAAPKTNADVKPFCRACRGPHWVSECEEFMSKSADERKEFATKNNMCFGCLRKGHSCKECRHRDPRLMAEDPKSIQPRRKQETSTAHVNQINADNGTLSSMILPVVLTHACRPNVSVTVLAVLDTQSDCCLLTESVADELKLTGESLDLNLVTMSSNTIVKTTVVNGLNVRGLAESVELNLPRCYTRKALPINRDNIPRKADVQKWSHLRSVADKIPDYEDGIKVGLLIGFNCAAALMPTECISSGMNQPYGIKTALGWSVVGPVKNTQRNESASHFCYKTMTREMPVSQVSEMFDRGFTDAADERTVSVHDHKFLTIMEKGIKQEKDGHYSLPLPFKVDKPEMPDNQRMAKKTFEGLIKRLSKDEIAKTQYFDFMGAMLKQGHAERAPKLTVEDKGKFNYATHHGVQHPHKPGKTRVVFNLAREYLSKCLNQELLTGPDYINNLTGVLLRFRQERVAVSCDVKGMFYQVKVHEADRNYLRFYWYEDNDETKEVVEYRMVVHLFGATSSPGVANYTFRRLAEDQSDNYDEEVINFILHDFYVDDGLTSVVTVDGAITLILQSHDLCKKGGFWLQKYVSNSREVMQAVPEELRVEQLKNVNLTECVMQVERSLGIEWCLQLDAFQFRVTLIYKEVTRRNMLSCVSSIYDPLGLVSPIILKGRRLVQIVCRGGGSWDEPVPDVVREEWAAWYKELEQLENIKVKRCYKNVTSENVKCIDLHHFCDASEKGYGACSYARIEDQTGMVDVSLVMAKTRVTPNKAMSIPRLELQSAVLATQLATFVNKELSYKIENNYFWTDSMVTLGYINNDAKRFQIFVANRIQKIQATSAKDNWSHVGTKVNPADVASRGASVEELSKDRGWWNGPKMLESFKPKEKASCYGLADPEDPEIRKKSVILKIDVREPPYLVQQAERYSSWTKYVRILMRCKQFARKTKEKIKSKRAEINNESRFSFVTEKKQIEALVLAQLQEWCYEEIVKMLKGKGYPGRRAQVQTRKEEMKTISNLYKLDPYMSKDGLIRVGGRIQRANVSREIAHPILLPTKQHITSLIVNHFHRETAHAGAGTTVNQIRAAGFWLLRARSTVAYFIKKCVICRKLRGGPLQQRMSDLPEERVVPAPPFTQCGVDFCGPFMVTQARSQRKRWICVFVCLVSKSIHLEPVQSLTTSGFLNAYRRFVCRRGPIRVLKCDRGTNFVGARGEMDAALKEMNQDQIQETLLKENCDWVRYDFNVPQASHMGGIWERAIGSFKRAFEGLLAEHGTRLDDELLNTLIVETECIVNSRPLTYTDTEDPEAGEAITPQMLLTLKHKVVLPFPGNFVREDVYCRRRWRCVQYLANQFWVRWRREFLPTLQERKKWTKQLPNLQVDDVVLVIEENQPRNRWSMGRVSDITLSKDKQVRKVFVKTSTGVYERPIVKLVLLYQQGVQTPSESQ